MARKTIKGLEVIITDLEKRLNEQNKINVELHNKISQMQPDDKFENSPIYHQMVKEIEKLKAIIRLNEINTKSKDDTIKRDRDTIQKLLKEIKELKSNNVVNKLKKELEEQLKIQQNLHKDYGEVIKELTDELELQEKQKEEIQNKTKQIGNNQPINNNSKLKSNRVELPPREHDNDHVADAKDLFNNVKEKSKEAIDEISENHKKNTATSAINNNVPKTNENKCPKCGSVVDNSFIFCDKCGYKLK